MRFIVSHHPPACLRRPAWQVITCATSNDLPCGPSEVRALSVQQFHDSVVSLATLMIFIVTFSGGLPPHIDNE